MPRVASALKEFLQVVKVILEVAFVEESDVVVMASCLLGGNGNPDASPFQGFPEKSHARLLESLPFLGA